MNFPKNATTEDKIFLKQNYLDLLNQSRSDDQENIECLHEQIKTAFGRISMTKKHIEYLNQEIADVENTKV